MDTMLCFGGTPKKKISYSFDMNTMLCFGGTPTLQVAILVRSPFCV